MIQAHLLGFPLNGSNRIQLGPVLNLTQPPGPYTLKKADPFFLVILFVLLFLRKAEPTLVLHACDSPCCPVKGRKTRNLIFWQPGIAGFGVLVSQFY